MSTYCGLLHPGAILLEEFLKPTNVTQNELARALNIPVSRVNDIIKGTRTITLDTAVRLSIYFQTTSMFWINLQLQYDLNKFEHTEKYKEINTTVKPRRV